MLNTLSQTIEQAGKKAEWLELPDGSLLLMLPYGARVLGLGTAKNLKNFFWANPLLDAPDTAEALFARNSWHNTGGDRTWIAPELDVFFPNATSNEYRQPPQLDMSDYHVEKANSGIKLSRQMTLHLARSDRNVKILLSKWIGPAPNPLRYEMDGLPDDSSVEYAGYTQQVTLQLLDQNIEQPPEIGIWNLMQLPIGGQMLVPLYARTPLQKCFGDIPKDRVTISDHLLKIKVDFPGSHKIALKAASLCGRTGYLYSNGEDHSLLIRNFFVDPSGNYIDVQRHDPDDFGYAFQMCRVDEPAFGSFCEMEYHAPALGSFPDPTHSVDVSQVWAYRGSLEAINAVAQRLLGAPR